MVGCGKDDTIMEVSLFATASSLTLAWQDASNNEDGFVFERKTGMTGTFAELPNKAPANATTYVDSALLASTTYCYRVFAYNSAGKSLPSNTACGVTLPPAGGVPAAPSALSAVSVSSNQAQLSWIDNSNNETAFKIERKLTDRGSFVEIATVGAGVKTFTNTGLGSGIKYSYRVRATNASGSSAYSNIANVTVN